MSDIVTQRPDPMLLTSKRCLTFHPIGSLGIAVVDPRILGCVRTHTPQNTDKSTVTPNEPSHTYPLELCYTGID
jgi:hypothetical protein